MAKQSIAKMAKANGVSPKTAYGRISRGVSVAEATSVQAYQVNRNRKNKMRHGRKAEIVWAHLVADPLARPVDVHRATGVSYGYVHKLMSKVGTPREVFEREAQAAIPVAPTTPSRTRNTVIAAAILVLITAWMVFALGV